MSERLADKYVSRFPIRFKVKFITPVERCCVRGDSR